MTSLSLSQKPTREGPLLVLAIALICAVFIPLYQVPEESSFLPARVRKMVLGPEQIICYCCFAWGGFILLSRYLEVRRQRRVFDLPLLPTEEGARILPEDSRVYQRKIEQMTRGKPFILTNLIRLALSKFSITRSSADVSEVVRTQSDVEMGQLVSSMSTVHYLVWAIPSIGLLGTVRGLAQSMGSGDAANVALDHLAFAFDVTLVSLVVNIPLMFMLHSLQRAEETLVLDCQRYCLENLVARLYQAEPEPATP